MKGSQSSFIFEVNSPEEEENLIVRRRHSPYKSGENKIDCKIPLEYKRKSCLQRPLSAFNTHQAQQVLVEVEECKAVVVMWGIQSALPGLVIKFPHTNNIDLIEYVDIRCSMMNGILIAVTLSDTFADSTEGLVAAAAAAVLAMSLPGMWIKTQTDKDKLSGLISMMFVDNKQMIYKCNIDNVCNNSLTKE
uniref:Uncharacterized protein n=1 Tax=Glossina palpalis gambiensis TaxID=67801 RepID=A0A1B0BTD3_9MUSC